MSAFRRTLPRPQIFHDKRVRRALAADGRIRAVPGVHNRLVTQRERDFGDRPHEHAVIAARQIGAADGTGKQRVANEQVRGLPGPADLEAYAARAVARCVIPASWSPNATVVES